jgi:hypothetical protein
MALRNVDEIVAWTVGVLPELFEKASPEVLTAVAKRVSKFIALVVMNEGPGLVALVAFVKAAPPGAATLVLRDQSEWFRTQRWAFLELVLAVCETAAARPLLERWAEEALRGPDGLPAAAAALAELAEDARDDDLFKQFLALAVANEAPDGFAAVLDSRRTAALLRDAAAMIASACDSDWRLGLRLIDAVANALGADIVSVLTELAPKIVELLDVREAEEQTKATVELLRGIVGSGLNAFFT